MADYKPSGGYFRSPFSMGQLIFQQIDALTKTLMELMPRIRCRDIESVRPVWALLEEYYIKLHVALIPIKREQLEKELEDIEKMIKEWEMYRSKFKKKMVFPPEILCIRIRKFYKELYYLQQRVGLGLELEKVESIIKKGERYLSGK